MTALEHARNLVADLKVGDKLRLNHPEGGRGKGMLGHVVSRFDHKGQPFVSIARVIGSKWYYEVIDTRCIFSGLWRKA